MNFITQARIKYFIKNRRKEELKKQFGMFKYAIAPEDLKNTILTNVRNTFKLEPLDSLFIEHFYDEIVQSRLKQFKKPLIQNPNPTDKRHITKISMLENIYWLASIGAVLLSFYIYIKSTHPLFPYFH